MKNFTKNLPLVLSMLLIMPGLLTGCGRYGDPKPRQSNRSFAWEQVDITFDADCLKIDALLSGVYTNLDTVVLELSAGDSPENCSTCPFRPTESHILDDLNQIFDRQSGKLQFFHCPYAQSNAYRARIIGTNIYDTARPVASPEKLAVRAIPITDILIEK
ncbi:MAG: hypothetical protein LBM00_04830 [Deltaproteobacteria bacterium]|jgi:hypothetical protein|nr:hypothetical protein [Deltaproteobacteria bacterium]